MKFLRACVARAEAFFSRFLVQNDLFAPALAHLKLGKRNDCGAVSSAILELLAFIEKVCGRFLLTRCPRGGVGSTHGLMFSCVYVFVSDKHDIAGRAHLHQVL